MGLSVEMFQNTSVTRLSLLSLHERDFVAGGKTIYRSFEIQVNPTQSPTGSPR